MYRAYNARPIPQPRQHQQKKKVWLLYVVPAIVIIGIYAAICLLRPLIATKTTILPPVISGQVNVHIPWPTVGQAAFGADGYGLLATHNEQKPAPTASVTKVITALSVLEKMPLKKGDSGPMITLTDKDVAIYNKYVAKDGAVVPVTAGEKISEYQALQAMMLPSANNIADTTAI
ncbi:MAG: peptidase D-alanyl-D-alanine carboxypeptidase 1, D-alanyl-D-alanine carboxypeptidase, partial [Candidatus Saccharibacteria bacterium]|nr:peptidase D-alanyl-D-alanine carboxypeptidase 1, D-alanyl-D-alanine carboxypeptidase [Candidatus Saccharibacteria bacterium]